MTRFSRGLFVVFGFFCLSSAAYSQTTAEVVLDRGDYTALDEITGGITFNELVSCNTTVVVAFYGNSHTVYLSSEVHIGDKTEKLKGKLARDLPSGEYKSVRAYFNPCNDDADLKAISMQGAVLTFLVTAYSSPNKYPTSAEVALTVNQKQFLDTKILELTNLSVQLTNHLEDGATDTPQLHNFMIQIVRSAKDALDVTERQYRTEIMKSQANSPAFFADFRKQYDDLIKDLTFPTPGSKAEFRTRASLVLVQTQLKNRDPQARPTNNRSGTLSPSAGKVDTTLDDNASVYKYIKTTGRLTFDATLKSLPTGASVQYKKVLDDDFTDYSSPTNISRATFELATYIFKFSKVGCSDRRKRIDPYQDPTPEIEVEFNDCGRK